GPAEKCAQLKIGDRLISVNDQVFDNNFSHFDAWNLLKSMPEGMITLKILPCLIKFD
uniref:PDZ domain-containing protein n=1 Tax=Romanomermis culicivorax TaxID=13658 RepID=A0A915KTI8_ROMCU